MSKIINASVDEDFTPVAEEQRIFWGLIKVRPAGITQLNVLTMILVEYFGMVVIYWQNSFLVFYLQEQLDVTKQDLQKVITLSGSISTAGVIVLGMAMGLIYDVFGRKTPLMIFIVVTMVVEAFFPFLKSAKEFYIATLFEIPLYIIIDNPFVPDLIAEESHGMGNMLRTNTLNLANFSAQGLVILNATGLSIFQVDFIYPFFSFMMVLCLILVKIGMKDIITAKKQETGNEVTAQQVLKQAGALLLTEPLIALGIAGSTIQLLMKIIGGSTTTMVIQHYFQSTCSTVECDSDAKTKSKQFSASLQIARLLISIPLTIVAAWLTKFYHSMKLLVFSDLIVILGGVYMLQYTDDAGSSWHFTFGYLLSQILDVCNFIFTQTMLMQKLKAESRGVIMGLNTIGQQLGVLILFQVQAHIQGQYGVDYGKGGQAIFSIFYSVFAVYWVVLLGYVIKNRDMAPDAKSENDLEIELK